MAIDVARARKGPASTSPAVGTTGGRGVDFVVVGFGLGAIGVLLGLALRDRGRSWCRARAARAVAAGAFEQWLVRARRCGDAGATLLLAGLAICIATMLALIANVGDAAGFALTLGSGLLAGGAGITWLVAARHQDARSGRATLTADEIDDAAPLPLALAIAAGARRAGLDEADDLAPDVADEPDAAAMGVASAADELAAPAEGAAASDLNGNERAVAVDRSPAGAVNDEADELPLPPGGEDDPAAETDAPRAGVLTSLPHPS